MKRVAPLFLGIVMLVPALVSAQVAPPPPPPTPPASPVPATAPVPQRPPVPPGTPVAPRPVIVDRLAIDDAIHAARMVDVDSIRHAADALRLDAEVIRAQALSAADQVRVADHLFYDLQNSYVDHLFYDLQNSYVYSTGSQSSEANRYSEALRLMDERKYESAITRFDSAISLKGSHADGAMYHKAYCQARLGQATEAVATLNQLRQSYPNSAYLKDARALEVDIKKLGPDQVDDEEIKILAIQSLQNQDPEKVIPLLETQLNRTNSLRVKDRALYVLAGIDNVKAHAILLTYAKGAAGNPELQRKAIRYIGSRNQKTTVAELIDIYNSTPDIDVKITVISAFGAAGAKSPLLAIASTGSLGSANAPTVINATQANMLRSRAMSGLTGIATAQELWPLFQKEENKDLRLQWVSVFSSMGAVEQLTQIAKTDKDPAVRNRAIRALGSSSKADATGTTLVDLYATGDKDTKSAVLSALASQNNAESLVAIARKETDKDLKLNIVKQLTEMAPRNKVAMDYIMTEILK